MMESTDIKFSSYHYLQQLSDFDKIEIFQGLCDNRWSWNEARCEGELRWRSDIIRNQILIVIDEWLKEHEDAKSLPEKVRKYNNVYFSENKKAIQDKYKEAGITPVPQKPPSLTIISLLVSPVFLDSRFIIHVLTVHWVLISRI